MKKRLILIVSILLLISTAAFFSYKYMGEDLSTRNIVDKSAKQVNILPKEKAETSSKDKEVEQKNKEDNKESENLQDKEESIEKFISDSEIDLDKAFNYPIILDSHNDTMMKVVDENTWLPRINLSQNTPFHIDIGKLKSGGLNIPFFAAYTEGYYGNTPRSISRTLALINALYFTEFNNKDTFKISKNLNDIVNTVNEGKIAAVPTIEGAYSLEEDGSLELLHQYKDLGIKAIGLTWNYSNKLGEGARRIYGDEAKTPSSGGLTELGEKVVREMNKLGIIVDVSHMAESTFWHVIETSRSPVIASHSGVAALKVHNRNLNDEQLKALAKNGGVISIVFYPAFLKDGDVYIKDIVDHIDYVVNLIGIDHVGLGSDFDGARMPIDLKDSSEIYKVKEELIKRNYSENDIEKILGKNILRVLKSVEDNADPLDHIVDINISPELIMGEKININTPTLKAKVETDRNIEKASIILDGKRYEALYSRTDSSISLQIKDPLKEKFHVATFEVEAIDESIKRETIIFYIDEN